MEQKTSAPGLVAVVISFGGIETSVFLTVVEFQLIQFLLGFDSAYK